MLAPRHNRRRTFKSLWSHSLSLTLAAGALAAVNDGQDDRLAVATVAPQVEEAHGVVRVQAVTAALTRRPEVGLLRRD